MFDISFGSRTREVASKRKSHSRFRGVAFLYGDFAETKLRVETRGDIQSEYNCQKNYYRFLLSCRVSFIPPRKYFVFRSKYLIESYYFYRKTQIQFTKKAVALLLHTFFIFNSNFVVDN